MKPSTQPEAGPYGIVLEDISEIHTAHKAVDYVAKIGERTGILDAEITEKARNLAQVLGGTATIHEKMAPVQDALRSDASNSGTVNTAVVPGEDGFILHLALRLAAEHHPDELVRVSAQTALENMPPLESKD